MPNSTASKLVILASCVLVPPLTFFLLPFSNAQRAISVVITIAGFHIPGVLYALYYTWPYLTDKEPIPVRGGASTANATVSEQGTAVFSDDIERGLHSEHAQIVPEQASEPEPEDLYTHTHTDTEPRLPSYSDVVDESSGNTPLLAPSDAKIQH
jgi:uncharacterized membrane protein YqaE (UPF0057 family)